MSPETLEKAEVMVRKITMYGWLLRSLHSSGSWQSVLAVKCQAGQVHVVCGEFLGLKEHCGYYEIPSWLAGAPQGFSLGFRGHFDCQHFSWLHVGEQYSRKGGMSWSVMPYQ